MVTALAVILKEDSFHNLGNLSFNWLEWCDQILHGAVAGTDVYPVESP